MADGCRRFLRRAAILAVPALLFALLFLRITLLACISERSKQIASLEREMKRTALEMDHAELAVNRCHDLDSILSRALELGMAPPEGNQIRVIHIDKPDQNTPAEE